MTKGSYGRDEMYDANDLRLPDYRISLMNGELFSKADFFQSFYLYIDERTTINDSLKHESIKGTVSDKAKIGVFSGEITDKFIDIKISFTNNSDHYGINGYKIICRGPKINNSYRGLFGLAENGSEEVKLTNRNRFGVRKCDYKLAYSEEYFKNRCIDSTLN
ncbi:MAG: hypothetical protein ACP5OA_00405 [Candidatus Woesearchaeota archaeon]